MRSLKARSIRSAPLTALRSEWTGSLGLTLPVSSSRTRSSTSSAMVSIPFLPPHVVGKAL